MLQTRYLIAQQPNFLVQPGSVAREAWSCSFSTNPQFELASYSRPYCLAWLFVTNTTAKSFELSTLWSESACPCSSVVYSAIPYSNLPLLDLLWTNICLHLERASFRFPLVILVFHFENSALKINFVGTSFLGRCPLNFWALHLRYKPNLHSF